MVNGFSLDSTKITKFSSERYNIVQDFFTSLCILYTFFTHIFHRANEYQRFFTFCLLYFFIISGRFLAVLSKDC